jgi:hypothetical protein
MIPFGTLDLSGVRRVLLLACATVMGLVAVLLAWLLI